jgi:hypothetical protein
VRVRRTTTSVLAGTTMLGLATACPARAEQPPPPTDPYAASTPPGFMVGATVGELAPVLPTLFNRTNPLTAGPAIRVGAGLRKGSVYVGASYEHAFLGLDTWNGQPATAQSDYGGADLVLLTAPEAQLSAFFHFSLGYRVINEGGFTVSSADLRLLGVGLSIRAGALRIVPEASLEAGPQSPYVSFALTTYYDSR